MGLNAKDQPMAGGDFVEQEILKIGNYPGRLVSIIDLGLQPQLAWKGEDKPPIRKINLTYELADEFMLDEDGNEQPDKPRWISETIPFHNLKSEKAKSTRRIKQLDPEGVVDGDISAMGGFPCMINIINNEKNGKTYNNVGDISTAMSVKGYEQPELVKPVRVFITDEPDMEVFNELPEWLQDMIKSNLKYNGSALQEELGEKAIPEPEPAGNAKPPAPPAPPAPDVPQ